MAGRLAPERWTDDPTELYPDADERVVYVDREEEYDDREREIPTHYSVYHGG